MREEPNGAAAAPEKPKFATEEVLPDGSRRVTLRKSIRGLDANKENVVDIGALVFREPTGEDIETAGNPVMINDKFDVRWDERKMSAMLAQLSGTPTSSIRKLTASDWAACAWAVTPFFLPWYA
jgi:hypothetical protein